MALPVYAADLGGRVLNIGSDTTYPPHEFIEDGVVKGFDVDVVAEICERINCSPNWVTPAWDGARFLICTSRRCSGLSSIFE